MRKNILLAVALVGLGATTAAADPILRISNLPTTYTPGSTITFNVDLIGDGTTALSSYGISLIASSATGAAGTDFAFSPATEGAGNIFPGNPPAPGELPFLPGIPGTALPNSATLSFTDGILLLPLGPAPVTVGAGVSQTVASINLSTLAGAVGDLNLNFDVGNTQLLDGTPPLPSPGGPLPVSFTTELRDTMGGVHSGTITAVPEPGTMGLLGFGSLGFVAWRLRRRVHSQSSAVQA